ncbi:MAG: nuclear transport factor 2 family protein [Anaerolineales bacterium]|jgi:predicted SnoaL-like aldol condensation-catalyzing enzyme
MPAHETLLLKQSNEVLDRHDEESMMALMTGEPLFENTYPAPNGTRYQGFSSVKQFWEEFFASSPQARIEIEEMFVCQERGMQRWVYHWMDDQGIAGHVRGVDVFRFQDGKIAE